MNAMGQGKFRRILENYFGDGIDDDLLERFETRQVPGGEWLFRQGDPGDSLYFVVRGRLQAWLEPPGEEPKLLGEISPGASVGEMGLLSGRPRSAGIRAIRDSTLVEIGRNAFTTLAGSHPELAISLAANIADMLERAHREPGGAAATVSTVTLLPLGDEPSVREFCDRFASNFCASGGRLLAEPQTLAADGAPGAMAALEGAVPDALADWLSDQEDEHEFILYRCAPGDSHWSRFAVRQSDIVLMVADAHADPKATAWEPRDLESQGQLTGQRALALVQRDNKAISGTAAWLDDRLVSFHLHCEAGNDGDVARAVRAITGTSTGLVMGGGAARGLAALGVYKALDEAGIEIDWTGGTSIGSIMAAAVARGWSPDEAIDIGRKCFKGGKPFSDFTLPVISLIRGERMTRLLREYVDVDIEDLALPYYCVSTNLGRGIKNVHERGSLVTAIRASAALPGVLPPVVVGDELAVDGALLDNLPVDIMKRKPVGEIIAVDFSSRTATQVDYAEMPSPLAVLLGRWLPFASRHRVPSLTTIMLKSTETGTLEEVRRHGEMADLLIDPDVRRFGMTDVKSFDAIVEAGYVRAVEKLAERA